MIEKWVCPECGGLVIRAEVDGPNIEEWLCTNGHYLTDRDHVERTRAELIEKGVIQMANEPLADSWYAILLPDFPGMRLVKIGIGQYITINDEGRAYAIEKVNEGIERLEKQLADYRNALFQL